MKRRGRPPYPDILTPRQQEVLALLREGLTNPQIAERLGISLDGAKFLVGEIIGRLGVSDRAAAARWQPAAAAAPVGRLAWAMAPVALLRRITPSWLPPAVSGAVIVAVLAGVGVLTWAWVREPERRRRKPWPRLALRICGNQGRSAGVANDAREGLRETRNARCAAIPGERGRCRRP